MRIRLTTTTYHDGEQVSGPGDELTVADEIGQDLIVKGGAVPVDEPLRAARPRAIKKED